MKTTFTQRNILAFILLLLATSCATSSYEARMAKRNWKQKSYTDAVDWYNRALQDRPGNKRLNKRLARVKMEATNYYYGKAETHYRKNTVPDADIALEMTHKAMEFNPECGKCHDIQQKIEAAKRKNLKLVEEHLRHARDHFATEQWLASLESINKAIALNPKDTEVLDFKSGLVDKTTSIYQSQADKYAAEQKWQLAVSEIEKLKPFNPGRSSTKQDGYIAQAYTYYKARAESFDQAHDWDKAIAECDAALLLRNNTEIRALKQTYKNRKQAFILYKEALAIQQTYPVAVQKMEKAHDLFPENREISDGLFETYRIHWNKQEREGYLYEALKLLKSARQLNPGATTEIQQHEQALTGKLIAYYDNQINLHIQKGKYGHAYLCYGLQEDLGAKVYQQQADVLKQCANNNWLAVEVLPVKFNNRIRTQMGADLSNALTAQLANDRLPYLRFNTTGKQDVTITIDMLHFAVNEQSRQVETKEVRYKSGTETKENPDWNDWNTCKSNLAKCIESKTHDAATCKTIYNCGSEPNRYVEVIQYSQHKYDIFEKTITGQANFQLTVSKGNKILFQKTFEETKKDEDSYHSGFSKAGISKDDLELDSEWQIKQKLAQQVQQTCHYAILQYLKKLPEQWLKDAERALANNKPALAIELYTRCMAFDQHRERATKDLLQQKNRLFAERVGGYSPSPVDPMPAPPITPSNIKGQHWAVVIGISKYQDRDIPQLQYADKDAEAFYDWLRSPGGGNYAQGNVKLLLNEDATLVNIKSALFEWLKQGIAEDMVTIYFAGHGSAESPSSKNLFFLPYDCQSDNISITGFPMWDIETAIRRYISSKKVVVIADACHSGGVGDAYDIARREARAFKEYNPISEGISELAKIGNGICVLSASSANQLSYENMQYGGGHGVFTHFLLEGLGGGADMDHNHMVTLGELITYTSEKVRRATQNEQTPMVSGNYDPALSLQAKKE